ncbi:major sperm protein isoform beta [Ditylenchus destructor]|uniref:Major sperm protein isoform beta n=1 Tax=Ditylenchus destructor TaxID=166010 RepID=A0AAD4QY14_9BILA|nr:major sperm protein isoform beta [Ditylenchus destructor]
MVNVKIIAMKGSRVIIKVDKQEENPQIKWYQQWKWIAAFVSIAAILAGGGGAYWSPSKSNAPTSAVPAPKESVTTVPTVASEDTQNDRITIERTSTLEEALKQFRREWFQGDGMVRRKNLPIEYILISHPM